MLNEHYLFAICFIAVFLLSFYLFFARSQIALSPKMCSFILDMIDAQHII